MRSMVVVALLTGCGGGTKSSASAPPPPGGGTRGLQVGTATGAGSGSAQVATNDPCEGGEVAMFADGNKKVSSPAGGAPGGGYTAEEINRVIKAQAGKIKACYQSALANQPDLQGKVIAKFKIGPDGKVTTATVTGMATEVTDCVRAVVEQLAFPAKGTDATVSYPFLFSSGG